MKRRIWPYIKYFLACMFYVKNSRFGIRYESDAWLEELRSKLPN